MQRRLGPLRAEVIEAESPKFTAPMLLLHGLWARASVWRRFMGFLSHRGWQCVAVERERGSLGAPERALTQILEAIAVLEAPPVIVGHDVGALFALLAAGHARAVVALAPIVPPPTAPAAPRLLRHAGTWLQRIFGRPLSPPREYRSDLRHADVREPPSLVRALTTGPLLLPPLPPAVPSVVWVAANDPVMPMETARALATHTGAELRVCSTGGHDLPSADGWEGRVSDIHRWVIQRLGSELLAFYEDETES